jgi:hypothetical protein
MELTVRGDRKYTSTQLNNFKMKIIQRKEQYARIENTKWERPLRDGILKN